MFRILSSIETAEVQREERQKKKQFQDSFIFHFQLSGTFGNLETDFSIILNKPFLKVISIFEVTLLFC